MNRGGRLLIRVHTDLQKDGTPLTITGQCLLELLNLRHAQNVALLQRIRENGMILRIGDLQYHL